MIKAYTKNRFLEVLWTLHFNDNTKAAPRGNSDFTKLYKVEPLVNALPKKILGII